VNPLFGIVLGIAGLVVFVGALLGALWLVGWALRRLLSRLTLSPPALLAVGLTRNWLRTALTVMSITMALFLFGALGGVLDTLQGAIRMSSETRLVTRDARSLVFFMPIAYRERLAALPGVTSVSIQNWFGGRDPKDPHNFFAQFGVDAATFFPMYANDIEIVDASPPQAAVPLPAGMDPRLAAFMSEQTACVVGEKLFTSMHWKLGQTVTLEGTIFPGSWPFTIRAVYRTKNKAFREETMFFHAKYLTEKGMGGEDHAGLFILKLADPSRAAEIAKRADALFENSSQATHTETERAFQAGFVSMYGNIPFVLRVIGLAVVFSILLVAANTMLMSFRERTSEFGVLKTLGFTDGAIFTLVLAEAAVITLGGGVLGSLLAKRLLQGVDLKMLPPMLIDWSTVARGIVVALLLGAVSGLIPAWQASKLRIVDALRRV
jgi:putative ABC transport system permease protein